MAATSYTVYLDAFWIWVCLKKGGSTSKKSDDNDKSSNFGVSCVETDHDRPSLAGSNWSFFTSSASSFRPNPICIHQWTSQSKSESSNVWTTQLAPTGLRAMASWQFFQIWLVVSTCFNPWNYTSHWDIISNIVEQKKWWKAPSRTWKAL